MAKKNVRPISRRNCKKCTTIVNFFTATTKVKALNQNTIDRQRLRSREAARPIGLQTVSWLRCMVFRVEAEREVGDKEESGLDLWKRVLSVLSERPVK